MTVADWFRTHRPVMRLAKQVGRLPDGNVRDVLAYGTDALHAVFECSEYNFDDSCSVQFDAFSYANYSGERCPRTAVATLVQRPYWALAAYLPRLQGRHTPRYEHDCDECIPLGRYEKYDLYACPGEPTVIARYGAKGDYESSLALAHLVPSLGVALQRAKAIGLFSEY